MRALGSGSLILVSAVLVALATPLIAASPGGRASVSAGLTQVWYVTSSADSGPGSLRQALLQAAGGDTITFDPSVFPPGSPKTIFPLSQLPAITQDRLTLDAGNAGAILDGSAAEGDSTPGLDVRADEVVVRGLQIVRFPGCGIELRGQNNTIGGDRQAGSGPLGQANLISGNGVCGLGMWESTTSHNTIRGNLIGVDQTGLQAWGNGGDGIHINGAHHNTMLENVLSGNGSGIQGCCNADSAYNVIRNNWIGVGLDGQESVPNKIFGVWFHDGAGHNTVGPGNTIAYNPFGVQVDAAASVGNTITSNSIYSNTEAGIRLADGANGGLAAPQISSFNLAEGVVWGHTCSYCVVEIFSDQGEQGALYEGRTTADAKGLFSYDRSLPLLGPHLTATATDAAGNTSSFSAATTGSGVEWVIQTGNYRPIVALEPKNSPELEDNRIGGGAGPFWRLGDLYAWVDGEIAPSGVKRFKTQTSEVEEPIDWSRPETPIDAYFDSWVTYLADQGFILTYQLSFWDKVHHPDGWTGITSRFKTAEDVQRFQDFVRYVVAHFCGRVPYFEIWNEPDNDASPVQYIEPQDYIAVTSAVIPIIRSTCPQAKIVVGSTSYLKNDGSRNYMLEVVRSELMPLVDVVAWHSMFGSSPAYPEHSDYYYAYPAVVQQLKDEASTHGFNGEYRGDEIVWRSPDCPWCAPEDPLYTNITAAKYYARGTVMNLGLDLAVSPTGTSSLRKETYRVLQNLATLFAGAVPTNFPTQLDTTINTTVRYTFALSGNKHLVTLWNDGIAADEDPGVDSTLVLPGLAGQAALGIDPLHGLVQSLIVSDDGDDLVIEQLRVKDYPLLVLLSPAAKTYLPVVGR